MCPRNVGEEPDFPFPAARESSEQQTLEQVRFWGIPGMGAHGASTARNAGMGMEGLESSLSEARRWCLEHASMAPGQENSKIPLS